MSKYQAIDTIRESLENANTPDTRRRNRLSSAAQVMLLSIATPVMCTHCNDMARQCTHHVFVKEGILKLFEGPQGGADCGMVKA